MHYRDPTPTKKKNDDEKAILDDFLSAKPNS